MIIRLSVLLSLLLALSSQAVAAGLEVVYDGAHRLTALDVALDGSNLWVATSWGIALYDGATDVPQLVTTRALEGTTSSVEVGVSRVYVGSGRSVFVFDRGTPAAIRGTGQSVGTINDILLVEPYLYAATSVGVEQFDLLDPDKPIAIRKLSTSTGFAQRLALAGTTLYAADGDSSVEAYTVQVPSFPQGIGSFGSLPRTQAVSEAGGRIYVSDGRRTDIWFGSGANLALVGSIAAGGNSALASGSRYVFVAGDDRRLRAFDVASGSNPVKVFASDAAPVGGTVNRMLRIVSAGSKLHVASGDAGLLSWDVSEFGSPFLVRGYETGTGNSLAAWSGGVAATLSEAGLTKFAMSAEGELSSQASWDLATTSVVRDATDTSLLVASGARLRRFDLTKSPPSESGSVTLSSSVLSAAFHNGSAVAVLADQSVWTVDFGAGSASRVDLGGALPLFVASGGGDLAFGEFNEDGTTTVRFFAGGNLGASPVTAVVEGAASSGISLSNRSVACFTFRGISVVDFAAGGAVRVIPGSNMLIARDLQMSGSTLFLLSASRLQVWDVSAGALVKEVSLESDALAVAHREGESSAVVATADGLVTVQYATAAAPPPQVGTPAGDNRYFRSALLGDRLLHLWDGRDVSTSALDLSGRPAPGRELSPAEAATGVAAVGDGLFFITPGGEVAGYAADGRRVSEYQVNESPDQRVLSMRSVAGALWVSVEVNCLSGGCEFRTLVLDPRGTITKSATIAGGAIAAAVAGEDVWAVFEVPDEIRTLDVSDPYHPTVVAAAPSRGDPVAVARDAQRGATYALGDLLYVYDNSLNLVGELLTPYEIDPSGRVSYLDQSVHVIGAGAVITGRSFSPEVYTIGAPTAWFPTDTPGSKAAAVRSSVLLDGRLYLLSDYSLEIWSTGGSERPRRRPVR